ncbi:MAG: 3-dehydroquinate synthase [Aestuariibacter sp.]
MTTLTVQLGARSYPIYVDAAIIEQAEYFSSHIKSKRVVVVSNETVAPLYLKKILSALSEFTVESIIIPDGEQYKTLETYEFIMSKLLAMAAARDTTLLALGGGVVGDITGFVAATYQRGIPFIQIPTTLLAQVDSSVGGKTAVNHPLGKNMIGAFYQPAAVIIDTDTLKSLPEREFAAGMAEVIKYGIIYDASFFTWLESNIAAIKSHDQTALQYIVHRCCAIKAEIVAKDEREAGIRAWLNLGHTFGHAIEAEQGYGNWLHGEAVAAGMVLACMVAELKQWLTASEVSRVIALIEAFDLPVNGPKDMGYETYMQHMIHDKKVAQGAIRFVIPQSIGQATVTSEVSETELRQVIAG